MSILKNIREIKKDLNNDVKLVVVTKGRSVREINQAIFIGVRDVAENKVQEAQDKKPLVKGDAKWHFIGHLQTNKVKQAVELFDMIQSLDSLKLARRIDSACKSKGKIMAVLVQVNIAAEPQKYGLAEKELVEFLETISELKNIKVLGLMAIAPNIPAEKTRIYFHRMRILFNTVRKKKIRNIEMKYLSIGMSNDYKVAVQEGSNMVRIGTAVFSGKKDFQVVD